MARYPAHSIKYKKVKNKTQLLTRYSKICAAIHNWIGGHKPARWYRYGVRRTNSTQTHQVLTFQQILVLWYKCNTNLQVLATLTIPWTIHPQPGTTAWGDEPYISLWLIRNRDFTLVKLPAVAITSPFNMETRSFAWFFGHAHSRLVGRLPLVVPVVAEPALSSLRLKM